MGSDLSPHKQESCMCMCRTCTPFSIGQRSIIIERVYEREQYHYINHVMSHTVQWYNGVHATYQASRGRYLRLLQGAALMLPRQLPQGRAHFHAVTLHSWTTKCVACNRLNVLTFLHWALGIKPCSHDSQNPHLTEIDPAQGDSSAYG